MLFDDITFITIFADPSKSTVAGKVGYALAPTGPRSAAWRSVPPYQPNVNGLAISGLGKQKEAAWLLVQYLSDKATSKQYMLQGGLAPRQSAWTDPEVVKALDPEFLETGRISTQINGPGAAPHSITNVSKARDFIGEVVVTAIQGGNVKTALEHGVTAVRRPPEGGAREEVVRLRSPFLSPGLAPPLDARSGVRSGSSAESGGRSCRGTLAQVSAGTRQSAPV